MTLIKQLAQDIIENGNGWAVRVSDMLEVPEEHRTAVWREIVKIGASEE